MDKQDVLEKIRDVSDEVHQKTLRGIPDVILLSERCYEVVEDEIEENKFGVHQVIQPAEWSNPPMSPCDIRAIYFGGNVDYERVGEREDLGYGDNINQAVQEQTDEWDGPDELDIPQIELGFTEEQVDDVVVEHTFE